MAFLEIVRREEITDRRPGGGRHGEVARRREQMGGRCNALFMTDFRVRYHTVNFREEKSRPRANRRGLDVALLILQLYAILVVTRALHAGAFLWLMEKCWYLESAGCSAYEA